MCCDHRRGSCSGGQVEGVRSEWSSESFPNSGSVPRSLLPAPPRPRPTLSVLISPPQMNSKSCSAGYTIQGGLASLGAPDGGNSVEGSRDVIAMQSYLICLPLGLAFLVSPRATPTSYSTNFNQLLSVRGSQESISKFEGIQRVHDHPTPNLAIHTHYRRQVNGKQNREHS